MNWKVIALPVSIVPFVIIFFLFDVEPAQILEVGVVPFVGASLAMISRVFIAGVKFNYLVNRFFGPLDKAWRTISVRMGSEFLNFTTPMFVGGEIVRIFWMQKKGIPTGKASWVIIMEIVTEVLAAGIFAFAAAILAFWQGAYIMGATIMAISGTVTSLWVLLFFFSSKKTFQVPGAAASLVKKIDSKRMPPAVDKINQWLADTCEMSRQTIHNKAARGSFVVAMLLSFLLWIFYGMSFLILSNGAGYFIDFFDSLMAVMASNAIGNLPITIGGSGLTEFGIWAYLAKLNGLSFEIEEGNIQWHIVIAWRIATYHVPLLISWLLLMRLALGPGKTSYKKPAG